MSVRARSAALHPIVAAALLLVPLTVAEAQPPPGSKVPVLFVPWQLPEELLPHEEVLRSTLTARLLGRGRCVEAVSGHTGEALQQCVRQVNSDTNDESCWIRVGQGQGAAEMVAGRVNGSAASCTLTLRRTHLERRVVVAMHVEALKPCGQPDLLAAAERAVAALDPEPEPASPATAVDPPPPPKPVAPEPPRELRVELWEDRGFSGRLVERAGRGGDKLRRSIRGRVSSLRVAGDGWAVLYSNDDLKGARLVVPGGVTITDLGRIPKVNSAMRNPLLPESDWDNEAEACELRPPEHPPEDLDDGRLTVIEGPGRGYRIRGGRRRPFSF